MAETSLHDALSRRLEGKHILYGITGSIAAVKAPIVARELMRAGASVTPVLTDGALHFTTATALSALTQRSAISSIFPGEKAGAADAGTWHIHLARSADAMLIAPASASTIGKLAAGIYDNAVLLLAASLPSETPLWIAPAMDEEMWLQPAVQENLRTLAARGVTVIDPVTGALASGLTGKGRMPEPAELVERFSVGITAEKSLAGKRVLVTGGPTYERIDGVRFIGNRSTGKMAVALANAAREKGAEVTLVLGPTHLEASPAITRIDVETSEEMLAAVLDAQLTSDIIVMNAAVADFAAAEVHEEKLKKREMPRDAEGNVSIKLKPTVDILSRLAEKKHPAQLLIGFALEKGDSAERYALGKLEEKHLDMIVLNDFAEPGAGFGHDTNRVTMYTRTGEKRELPLLSKEECAREIMNSVVTLLSEHHG